MRQVHMLVDKTMSRSYAEYVSAKKKLAEPMKLNFQLPVEGEIGSDEDDLKTLNGMLG
jgi:hypothetical protein